MRPIRHLGKIPIQMMKAHLPIQKKDFFSGINKFFYTPEVLKGFFADKVIEIKTPVPAPVAIPMAQPTAPTPFLQQTGHLPPKLQDLKSRSILALINLGSIDFDFKGLELNDQLSLSFTISALEKVVNKPFIPEKDRKEMQRLIHCYKASLRLIVDSEELGKATSAERITNEKSRLKGVIVESLKRNGELFLASGYSAQPAGHSVSIKLVYNREKNTVTGKVFNRGEGLGYHEDRVEGTARKFYPTLYLKEISLEDLASSDFLDAHLELQLISDKSRIVAEKTNYNIDDFYHNALGLWAAGFAKSKTGLFLEAQKGGTCTIKSWTTPMKEVLSKETCLHVNLYLRMGSLELFHHFANVELNDISNLEWAVKRLNRSLLELEKPSAEETALVERLSDEISFLITKVKRQEMEKGHDLEVTPLHFQDNEKCYIVHPKQPSLQKGFELNRPDPKNPFAYNPYELHTSISSAESKEHITLEYLETLPLATDPLWLKKIPHNSFEFWFRCCIEEFVKIRKNRLSGDETILICNAVTGFLCRMKDQGADPNCLAQEASKLLTLITNAGALLRITHPSNAKRLAAAREGLSTLITVPTRTVMWQIDSSSFTDEKKYRTQTELLKDPFIHFFYQMGVAEMGLHFQGERLITKNTSDPLIGACKHFRSPLSSPEWVNALLKLPKLTYALFGPGKEDNTYLICSQDASVRDLTVQYQYYWSLKNKDNPTYGLLIDVLCNWTKEDGPIVDILLDRRIPVPLSLEPTRALDRTSQNKQMLISCNTAMQFGNVAFSAEEIAELLSITLYEEMLIPATISYFQKHLVRLENPYFRILFDGFLSTKRGKEAESILSFTMQNPKNQIAEQFLNFLEEGIFKTDSLPSLQIALARASAQSYCYLQVAQETGINPIVDKRLKRTEALLKVSMSKIERKGGYFAELVSLTPYVDKNPALLRICEEAYVEYTSSGTPKVFTSHLEQSDLTKGVSYFETHALPDDRLPFFVYKDIRSYLVDKNHPATSSLDQKKGIKEYFFKDNGVDHRLQVSGREFILQKSHQRSDGSQDWFTLRSAKSEEFRVYPEKGPLSPGGILRKNAHLWVSTKEPTESILFAKTIPFKPICFMTQDRVIHPENPELTLAACYKSEDPLMKKWLSFDAADNILIWKNKHSAIQEFEFPTYGLTFKRAEENVWKCESVDLHGYSLKAMTPCFDLEPYLHYLVLTNAKGGMIAIMPNRQVSNFPYKDETTIASEVPKLLIFPLTPAGRLENPTDPIPLAYLIYLSLSSRNYERARELIDSLSLHRNQWNKEESHLIQEARYKDKHPHAAALRIRLKILEQESTRMLKEPRLQLLLQDYLTCLEQSSAVGPDWLSIKEEKKALHFLVNLEKIIAPNNQIINNRCKELGLPTIKFKNVEQTGKNIISKQDYVFVISDHLLEEMVTALTQPKSIVLKTRPGEEFAINFLCYYQIALSGSSQEQKALRELLVASFPRTEERQESSFGNLHHLILTVLNSSKKSKFPTVESLLENHKKAKIIEKLSQSKDGPYLFSDDRNKFEAIVLNTPASDLEEKLSSFANIDFPSKPQLENISKKLTISSQLEKFPIERVWTLLDREAVSLLGGITKIWTAIPKLWQSLPPLKPVRTAAPLALENTPLAGNFSLKLEEPLLKIRPYLEIEPKELVIHRLQENVRVAEELLAIYDFPDENPSTLSTCKTTRQGILIKVNEMQEQIKAVGKVSSYRLDSRQTKMLVAVLENTIAEQKAILKKDEEKLTRTLRTYPPELMKEVLGGLIREPTLQRCLIYFAKESDQQILHANPSLKDCFQTIKTEIAIYLDDLTNLQHMERSLKKLEEALEIRKEGSKEASSKAEQQFLTTIGAKRAYDETHPHFQALLAFEALANLRLRVDQVVALEKMTLGPEGVKIELEARTGFGKSQVLIPLWLFLTSNKDRLTVMVVPTSLLPDQERHLKRLLGNTLGKGIQTITFDRKKLKTLDDVKWLNEQFFEAKKEGRVILTDMKTLQGLVGLGLKEALYNERHYPSASGRVLIDELILLKKTLKESFVFIDESRDCLDARQRYDYASGLLTPIQESYVNASFDFWQDTILTEDILAKWNFEFLPNLYSPAKKTLTKANFQELQEEIASKIIKKFPENLGVMTHVLGKKHSPEVKAKLESLPPALLSYYEFCRKQISENLERSLLKVCDTDYGPFANQIAIPFKKGIPKPSSEFASLDDLINATLQANLKTPIDLKTVAEYIESFQELQLKGEELSLHPSFKLFTKIKEAHSLPSFEVFRKKDLLQIQDILNNSLEYKLSFIAAWILPKIRISPYKISGTSFTVISSLSHVHVASGTVDPNTTHRDLQPEINPDAPIGNLLAMFRSSILYELSPDNSLTSLLALCDPGAPPVVIDVAGFYQTMKEEDIIRTFFQANPTMKGLTYYDTEGRCMIREKGAVKSIGRDQTSLKPQEIGVFIRQSNAIGSDTPMQVTAKGIVTISKDTLESFFLQGAGRMRGLETGQTINFALTEEAIRVIQKSLNITDVTVKDLYQYLKKLEGKQKGLDYFVSLGLFLEDLIEQSLWEKLDDSTELLQRFALLENFLVVPTQKKALETLFTVYQEYTPKEAAKLLLAAVLDPLKKEGISFIDFDALEKRFYAEVDWNLFPKTVSLGDAMDGQAVVEQETTVEEESIQENITENTREIGVIQFTPAEPFEWDGSYSKEFSKRPIKTLFDISIYPSPNLLVLAEGQDISHILRKPSNQFLVERSPEGVLKVMMTDLHDAKTLLETISSSPNKNQYYLISGSSILASTDPAKPTKIDKLVSGDDALKLRIFSKILAGNGSLTKAEFKWLLSAPEYKNALLALIEEYQSAWPSLSKLSDRLKSVS